MVIMNWEQVKESPFDYEEYLLEKLNNDEKILEGDFEAKKVAKDFVGSKLYLLHDGERKKTIATALHIGNREGKLARYTIRFMAFSRKNKDEKWAKVPFQGLNYEEVKKLSDMINEQEQFIGVKPDKQFYRVVSSDKPVSIDVLDYTLDLVLKGDGIDFSQLNAGNLSKIFALMNKIAEGENIVLERGLYEQLVSARTSDKSVRNYEDDIQRFKKLIANGKTQETDMQTFLNERIWFFGLNYIQGHRYSKPKFNSTLGSQYDFLLEGFNQVYDIAELKGPNEPLFEVEDIGERKTSFDSRTDYKFSQKFSRALHQVMSYMEEFESAFETMQTNQPTMKKFMYPKGTIVISKRALFPDSGKNSKKYLHLINRQFANIDILTYDDLADRGQIIIDFIKKVKD